MKLVLEEVLLELIGETKSYVACERDFMVDDGKYVDLYYAATNNVENTPFLVSNDKEKTLIEAYEKGYKEFFLMSDTIHFYLQNRGCIVSDPFYSLSEKAFLDYIDESLKEKYRALMRPELLSFVSSA